METVSIANPVKPRPWPLPPIFQEPSADPVATGLRIANAIRYAVYGPGPERVIPTPLPCSPTLRPKVKAEAR
jgi:hypothetical protein